MTSAEVEVVVGELYIGSVGYPLELEVVVVAVVEAFGSYGVHVPPLPPLPPVYVPLPPVQIHPLGLLGS